MEIGIQHHRPFFQGKVTSDCRSVRPVNLDDVPFPIYFIMLPPYTTSKIIFGTHSDAPPSLEDLFFFGLIKTDFVFSSVCLLFFLVPLKRQAHRF